MRLHAVVLSSVLAAAVTHVPAFAQPPPATTPVTLPPPAPPAPPAPPPAARELGLEEAIRLAMDRNERSRISELNFDIADAAVEKARSAFLPTITFVGSALQRPFTQVRNGVTSLPYNSGSGTLTANQPLINVPAFPLYRQAQRLLDAQRYQTAQDKRQIAFDTATAFFGVLSQEQVLKAARRNLELAETTLADTKYRAENQLNTANDVTRAEVQLATAQREVEIDKGSVERAYIALEFLLNARVEGKLAPHDGTLRAAEQIPASLDLLVATALRRRMDLMASEHKAIAAHLFAEEPLMRLIPTLGLTALFSGTTDTTASRWDNETLTLTLSWTIYDAGTRYADKRSRDAQAEQADLGVRLLKRQVDLDVRNALSSLTSAQAAFHVSERAVLAARKSVEESSVLYRQGLARAIEVTDAVASRFDAEVSYVGQQYTMAQSYFALRLAMGLDPTGTELR